MGEVVKFQRKKFLDLLRAAQRGGVEPAGWPGKLPFEPTHSSGRANCRQGCGESASRQWPHAAQPAPKQGTAPPGGEDERRTMRTGAAHFKLVARDD